MLLLEVHWNILNSMIGFMNTPYLTQVIILFRLIILIELLLVLVKSSIMILLLITLLKMLFIQFSLIIRKIHKIFKVINIKTIFLIMVTLGNLLPIKERHTDMELML